MYRPAAFEHSPHHPLASRNNYNGELVTAYPAEDSNRPLIFSLGYRPSTGDRQQPPPLTLIPATLTSNFANRRKTSSVNPLEATLTDIPLSKSFVYHSYEKQGVEGEYQPHQPPPPILLHTSLWCQGDDLAISAAILEISDVHFLSTEDSCTRLC